MKISMIALVGSFILTSTVFAAENNCEAMAIKAAKKLAQVNRDGRTDYAAATSQSGSGEEIIEVVADNSETGGGMSITYAVSVEKNSSADAKKLCNRVLKIELIGEE